MKKAPVCLLSLFLLPAFAGGQAAAPPRGPLADVSVEQKLGSRIPLDLHFRDESGASVELGSFYGRKPVILALVYYQCPMLCSYVLNGTLRSLRVLPFDAGREYQLVTVSIDPADKPAIAAVKKREFVKRYGRPGGDSSIHFLTGEQDAITRLASAVGFRYSRDPETGDFNHAAVLMVTTPSGVLSHYFFGIEYPPQDLRLALVDASGGRIGSPVDQVLLYCSHYDPATGRYSLAITRVIQLLAGATVVGVAILMIVLFRRERRSGSGRSKAA